MRISPSGRVSFVREVQLSKAFSPILTTALQQITIPDAVVSIGENAFESCTSLTKLTLPEGLILISEYAFYDCSSLEQINIPDGVTQIGTSVFDNCDQVVLSVTADSVGEQYALTNEIPYEILP